MTCILFYFDELNLMMYYYECHFIGVRRPFVPVDIVKLRTPFPPVILEKRKRSIRGSIRGSIHASSIISSSDEDTRESLKLWFESALALPGYFQLPEQPVSALQAGFSREFLHYKSSIEALGVGVWDIQETGGETVSVVLEDSNGAQKRFSGRAHFGFCCCSNSSSSCLSSDKMSLTRSNPSAGSKA